MKKALGIFLLWVLVGCTYRGPADFPAAPIGFIPGDDNRSSISAHPEYPLVASPHYPAWYIGLWVAGIITLVCLSPAVCRWMRDRWPAFAAWLKVLAKRLTKKQ